MYEWKPDLTQSTNRQWIAIPRTPPGVELTHEGSDHYLDIRDGSSSFSPSRLKLGALSHLTLLALGERPDAWISSEELFTKLYPGQYFHPVHARYRLKHVAFLLRSWLRAAGIPMDVKQKSWRYRLVPLADLRLRVGEELAHVPSGNPTALVWLREFARSEGFSPGFTAGMLAQFLSISNRSANYRLREAIAHGYVRARGRGRATRYELAIANLS